MNSPEHYRRYNVMLVDDEQQALKYFERAFRDDFRILTASSASAAMQIARERNEPIGVLITDQRMPGQSGVDLLQQFQVAFPDTVRILTTAYGNLESAIAAVNQGGVFRYITKPWVLDDLRGTILRALDYYILKEERDRLLREKLSVVQRMVVLDRLRGLSVLAAALDGVLDRSLAAFMSYVNQAPLTKRIQLELERVDDLDLIGLARREATNLIDAVREIRNDACDGLDVPETDVDLVALVQSVVADISSGLAAEGVAIQVDVDPACPSIPGNPRLLRRLFQVLIERLTEMDGEDGCVNVQLRPAPATPGGVEAAVTVSTPPWNNGQLASLYSAIMPIQRWPIGMDMDTFACFLITFHHRGKLEINDQPPWGPGFRLWLNTEPMDAPAGAYPDPEWFDRVFRQIEIWGRPF